MDRLIPEDCIVLVVDVQEKLFVAMPEAARARLLKNAEVLLEASRLLGVKVLASEQYPKGLGPTVEPLRAKLHLAHVTPMAKMDFDACGDPRLARAIAGAGARSIVVVGMETHVCVFQTARELARRGYATYVVADAVASRTEENRGLGLALCERAGAVITTTETVVFDWLRCAGTDAFKQVSKLLK
jgi:nicotinamidase-related amidase